jgi:hypothetical protein
LVITLKDSAKTGNLSLLKSVVDRRSVFGDADVNTSGMPMRMVENLFGLPPGFVFTVSCSNHYILLEVPPMPRGIPDSGSH